MVETFRSIYALLTRKQRRHLFGVFGLMCLLIGLELVCAGLVSLFAIVMTTPPAAMPELLGKVASRHAPWLIQTGTASLVGWVGMAVVVAILLKNSLNVFFAYCSRYQAASVGEHLGVLLFQRFLSASYAWHLRHNSAHLILAVQARDYAVNLLDGAQQVTVGTLLTVSVCAALVVLDPLVAGGTLAVFGLLGACVFRMSKRVVDANAHSLHTVELSLSKCVLMSLQGIKELKLYRAEPAFMHRFADELRQTPRVNAVLATWLNLPSQLLEVLAVGGLVAFVWGMYALVGKTTTEVVGMAGFLSAACWRVMPALSRILSSLTGIRRTIPRLEMYLRYLRESDGCNEAAVAEANLPPFRQALTLDGVTFTYEEAERPALEDITLAIPRGSVVGIVGTSGAGKSTLVDLLTGLISPDCGRVALDGLPLDTPQRRLAWMRRVGYVAQIPYILDSSLAENVAFGQTPEAIDRERVLECCSQAAMDDFLHSLPQTLDTVLGERGVLLSGGQRQRVAIARALYSRPEVLVLDEATSALDTRNEEMILKTTQALGKDLTRIVVAHRLSTVEDCDMVVWLDQGRVRAYGDAGTVLDAYRCYLGTGNDAGPAREAVNI